MQPGATLGRRFALLRQGASDLPGIERWVALDQRRLTEVNLDVITAPQPANVRRAALRATQVRDPRFVRVLSSGHELVDQEWVTFVVTEIPPAFSVAAAVISHDMSPLAAATVVAEASRALQVAAARGVHHGRLSPESLYVSRKGRLVIAGLGIDSELAQQAGLQADPTEQADAAALARVYDTLVSGDGREESVQDKVLPGLSASAQRLLQDVRAGNLPSTLAALTDALGPGDSQVLRELVDPAPILPAVPSAEMVFSGSHTSRIAVRTDTTLAAQQHAEARYLRRLAPAVAAALEISGGRVFPSQPRAVSVTGGDHAQPATPEELAQYSRRTQRLAERTSHEPLGLDTWDIIAAEQDEGTPPSTLQAVLEWLSRRWPGSVVLGAAAEQARHRAQRPPTLRSGPVLVSVFVAVTVVVTIVAFQTLRAPLDADREPGPDPLSHYPEFTFSPEPLPSPSDDE